MRAKGLYPAQKGCFTGLVPGDLTAQWAAGIWAQETSSMMCWWLKAMQSLAPLVSLAAAKPCLPALAESLLLPWAFGLGVRALGDLVGSSGLAWQVVLQE